MSGNEESAIVLSDYWRGKMPEFMEWNSREAEVARAVRLWIKTVRETASPSVYGKSWLPTEVDIVKSALLSRILSGKDPLPQAPPTAFSYPWYELIENGKAALPDWYVSGPYHGGKNSIFAEGDWLSIAQHPWKIREPMSNGWILNHGGDIWVLRRFREGEDRGVCGKQRIEGKNISEWEDLPCSWKLYRLGGEMDSIDVNSVE